MYRADDFFRDIFRRYRNPGYFEVRSLSRPNEAGAKGRRVDFFETVDELISAVPDIALANSKESWDTYFGVLPRCRRGHDKSVIRSASVVWVDLDCKTIGTKEDCLALLNPSNNGVPLPSYVVDSGNGLHAYWLLEEEVFDLDAIESINKGLAHYVRGDACHNRDRILRVPGSYNCKRDDRVETSIIRSTGLEYGLEGLVKFFSKGSELMLSGAPVRVIEEPVPYEKIDGLPGWVRDLVVHGISADLDNRYQGDRSRCDFYVVAKLLEEGFTPGEVLGVLHDYSLGISEKTRQAGLRYAENTVINAAKSVERRLAEAW